MAFIPRDEADRLKAFELYLNASNGGKFRSLRSIASEVGVSSVTIARWKEVDHWDDKLNKALATTANTQESTSNAVKRKLRSGLLAGLDDLQAMARDTSLSARDRIDAIKAISAIAIKVEAITAGTFGKDTVSSQVTDFNDELEEKTWPPTTERPSKPADSGDGVGPSPEPSRPLSPSPSLNNSEGDLASLLEASLPEPYLLDEGGEQ